MLFRIGIKYMYVSTSINRRYIGMYVVLVLGRLVRMVKLRTGLNNAKNSSHSGRKID